MSTTLTTTNGRRNRLRLVVLAVTAALLLVVFGAQALSSMAANSRPTIPTSTVVENASGVRFLRATLAADHGMIDVRYQVIDRAKAAKYAGDSAVPPVLDNDRNHQVLKTVISMVHRQDMKLGGTYFIIYHNTDGAVQRGDRIDITLAGVTLNNVPVE
jgi:hypothetical protein